MGGNGSGNWLRRDSKATIESQHGIDIRWLKNHGCLTPGAAGILFWSNRGKKIGSISYRMESDRLLLSYQAKQKSAEGKDVEDQIRLTWTPCHYGGKRQWFLCPGCMKRVSTLYGGEYFRCRHCHNLTYSSQQECKPDRLRRKARRIRERLGVSSNLSKPILFKPKNMHQKTFDRLRREADTASYLSLLISAEQLGIKF